MVEPERIYLNPILLLLLLLHGAEAQSAIQQAPPIPSANNWDASSVAVTMGALILMLLLVTLFSMFLRRCAESYSSRFTEQPRDWPCSCSQPGIPPDLLKTFPVIFYSSAVTGGEATATTLQCAVCLAEFNDGDTLRLLPHCNHVFHTQCIDAWLSSHVTCPVCRANLNRQDFPHVVVCVPDESNSRGRAEGGGEEVAGGDEDVCSGGEARGDAALE